MPVRRQNRAASSGRHPGLTAPGVRSAGDGFGGTVLFLGGVVCEPLGVVWQALRRRRRRRRLIRAGRRRAWTRTTPAAAGVLPRAWFPLSVSRLGLREPRYEPLVRSAGSRSGASSQTRPAAPRSPATPEQEKREKQQTAVSHFHPDDPEARLTHPEVSEAPAGSLRAQAEEVGQVGQRVSLDAVKHHAGQPGPRQASLGLLQKASDPE